MMTETALLVLTTVAGEDAAAALAATLVEERLAACVSRLPAHSVYRWQGGVESEPEQLLLIKTKAANWDALSARVRELHEYEVPELIAIEPGRLEPGYLGWLLASCTPAE